MMIIDVARKRIESAAAQHPSARLSVGQALELLGELLLLAADALGDGHLDSDVLVAPHVGLPELGHTALRHEQGCARLHPRGDLRVHGPVDGAHLLRGAEDSLGVRMVTVEDTLMDSNLFGSGSSLTPTNT